MDRKIVSHDAWLDARKAHLMREELTRLRDKVSAERRALPWVKVEKAYVFDTPDGSKTLADLVDGRSQLVVHHFVLAPGWKVGCTERIPAMTAARLTDAAAALRRAGRGIALYGVVAVLLLIGGLKFTAVEIAALENLIPPTPWLAWLYPAFGKAGASYLLGVVEIVAGLLLAVSPWWPLFRAAGGLLSSLIFVVTSSLLLVLPVGEPSAGGLPALNGLGQFLIKDIVLLGVALSVAADGIADLARGSDARAAS